MTKRVKEDGRRRWLHGYEDQFDRTTILRVIDEEIDHTEERFEGNAEYVAASAALELLRARFEEGSDD